MNARAPSVSVIIKTFNERRNIARTLESVIAATEGLDCQVIVADSLSTDGTAEVAARFPVKVVQLLEPADRSCGVGAQLGYQHASGDLLFVMDGDMELVPGFLEQAIAALESHPDLAGVAGVVEEVHASMLEQRNRQHNSAAKLAPGETDRLYGGGLYRRAALEDVGYFTDPHLHGFEELELALRLRARGWRLLRLPTVAVRHHGHTLAPLALLAQRWRTRYAFAPGEFLRVALDKPYRRRALIEVALLIGVLAWWAGLAVALGLFLTAPERWPIVAAVAVAPPLAMIVRRRSVALGLYAVAAWFVFAPGLIAGFLRTPRDPRRPIPARVL